MIYYTNMNARSRPRRKPQPRVLPPGFSDYKFKIPGGWWTTMAQDAADAETRFQESHPGLPVVPIAF